jgi:hypothetical protein
VQHVRVREDDVAAFADGFARVAGSIAIVGEDAEGIVEACGEVVKFGELILRERFGGEEVERAGIGALEDGIENRQVVAEGFAGRGGSDDNEIFALAGQACGIGLVGIELFDAFCAIGCG